MDYKTPRMLARTLKRVRNRQKVTQEMLAKSTGCGHTSISNYEIREDPVTYKTLDYCQLYFGVPNGVLLCISHVAAMTRDIASFRKGKKKSLEQAKLQLMGLYLKNLSERILEPGQQRDLEKWDRLSGEPGPSWDKLLNDLFLATQKGSDHKTPTVFKNHAKLKRLVAQANGTANSEKLS